MRAIERQGEEQFEQILSIAKASCGEVRSLAYLALNVGCVDKIAFDQVLQQWDECV